MPSKLVRDKIPSIIREKGEKPVYYPANPQEYEQKLHEKLEEEVQEYLESGDLFELADIMEVVYALARLQKCSPKKLENMREIKVANRGAFRKRIILEVATKDA